MVILLVDFTWLCVCVCTYIYTCVYVYIYIYISYKQKRLTRSELFKEQFYLRSILHPRDTNALIGLFRKVHCYHQANFLIKLILMCLYNMCAHLYNSNALELGCNCVKVFQPVSKVGYVLKPISIIIDCEGIWAPHQSMTSFCLLSTDVNPQIH